MKYKSLPGIVSVLTILLLLMNALPTSASAAAKVQDLIDGIVDYRVGDTSIQEWIDGTLSQNAGAGAEWYVLALRQSGDYNLSAYETALLRYLEENEVHSATTLQKYALILHALGSEDAYITRTLNDSIGQQGVMSWVFGLHLLNNGVKSENYTAESVKETLLSLQLADGGWAVMGTVSDVDVTAMTLQALAPFYPADVAVKVAVDKALVLLSERQLPFGSYATYGEDNAESVAQVMIALSSLGLDCATDVRFVKDGNTVFDALSKYQLADGGFSHTQNGAFSETATAQVLCGLVAYQRMIAEKGPLYILDAPVSEGTSASHLTTATATDGTHPHVGGNYKIWVCLSILIVAFGICTVLLLKGKQNFKNVVLVLLVAAVAIGVVWYTNVQSIDEFYNTDSADSNDAIGSVTLTIRCDAVVGKSDASYIPADGNILDTTSFAIQDGDTALDVLLEAAKTYKLHVEINGKGNSAYIEGIAHLYEFDFGALSGWLFYVNGESLSVGCGAYELSDGDAVTFVYSCDMGQDVSIGA